MRRTEKTACRVPENWQWLINVALLTFVGLGYLQHIRGRPSAEMVALMCLGLISCAATVSLVPGLLTTAARCVALPTQLRAILAAALWSLTTLLLFIDVQVYGIFRYHIDGAVWSAITAPGSGEAIHLEPLEIWIVCLGTALLFVVELFLFRFLTAHGTSRDQHTVERKPALRPGLIWKTLLIPAMLGQLLVLDQAEVAGNRNVLIVSNLFPVLPHLSIPSLGMNGPGNRPSFDIAADGVRLDYPVRQVALPEDAPTPNILFLVVDSLRADMLTPTYMPRTSAFARRAQVFGDHFSGGNATKFGVFSLIYGLPGCYWPQVLNGRQSPALIDALVQRGYRMKILTSASMSYPELRSTAWVQVEGSIDDRLRGTRPGGRDDGMQQRFMTWLGERRTDARPFMAFLLLDATHQSYAFPEEFARFRPYAQDLSYLKVASGLSDEEVLELENRYRNAVLYVDDVIGNLLDALQTSGDLEQTIVIITGDHGEEFMENGFYGHASNFTRAQLQVPLVWFDSKLGPGKVMTPTSHVDVPVTLLERLGLSATVRRAWSLGENLFDADPHGARIVAGWDSFGIELPYGRMLTVPMHGYGRRNLQVYEPDWQFADGEAEILAASGAQMDRMEQQCRQFLR